MRNQHLEASKHGVYEPKSKPLKGGLLEGFSRGLL